MRQSGVANSVEGDDESFSRIQLNLVKVKLPKPSRIVYTLKGYFPRICTVNECESYVAREHLHFDVNPWETQSQTNPTKPIQTIRRTPDSKHMLAMLWNTDIFGYNEHNLADPGDDCRYCVGGLKGVFKHTRINTAEPLRFFRDDCLIDLKATSKVMGESDLPDFLIPQKPDSQELEDSERRWISKVREMEKAFAAGNSRTLFQLIRPTGQKKAGVSETICEKTERQFSPLIVVLSGEPIDMLDKCVYLDSCISSRGLGGGEVTSQIRKVKAAFANLRHLKRRCDGSLSDLHRVVSRSPCSINCRNQVKIALLGNGIHQYVFSEHGLSNSTFSKCDLVASPFAAVDITQRCLFVFRWRFHWFVQTKHFCGQSSNRKSSHFWSILNNEPCWLQTDIGYFNVGQMAPSLLMVFCLVLMTFTKTGDAMYGEAEIYVNQPWINLIREESNPSQNKFCCNPNSELLVLTYDPLETVVCQHQADRLNGRMYFGVRCTKAFENMFQIYYPEHRIQSYGCWVVVSISIVQPLCLPVIASVVAIADTFTLCSTAVRMQGAGNSDPKNDTANMRFKQNLCMYPASTKEDK
ncbi:ATP-binding cassette transporter [Clonorchis sinensis]|uniref:ATP-binding cassette transporter n=1 Tax=Clonorchis sinensis TaxID=79923 RepID=G7YAK2_CLOSI|nr:ATP-binding cassette transporter [Clonorchis sinensis]